jgi:ribonuclease-3
VTSTVRGEADLSVLSARLGYTFTDVGLLRRAMAHRSWCSETSNEASNERLEFLGDAVLGWVIADLVYRRHGDLPEGKLTDLRKGVVNASALAEVARSIDLGDYLLLGKGEAGAGGNDKASILSDALEAVLGAVYLDGGVVAVSGLIDRLFSARLVDVAQRVDRMDYKTVLQELVSRRFETVPVYSVSSTGPDHDKWFSAVVTVAGAARGHGEGRSKKAAEQIAAAAAFDALSTAD